ncbi:MAG: polysaccharide deacetylase family protein [Armatimonadota bacterium]
MRPKQRKGIFITAATVFGIFAAGLLFSALRIRREEGIALSKGMSPVYWADRFTGKDYFDPARRIWFKGNRDRKTVCLTIDDGPHPVSCQRMIEVLKEKNVKAAFFLVGKQVDGNPDLVRMMVEGGHEICNHTYDHVRLDKLSRQKVFDQIHGCDVAVENAIGKKMTLFRPPGTRYSDTVLDVLKQKNEVLVYYTMGAKDFVGTVPDYELTPELRKLPKITSKLIQEYVLKQLKPGSIILLHDNPITAEALGPMIDEIRAKGYEFETCAEMMKHLPNPVYVDVNPAASNIVAQSR